LIRVGKVFTALSSVFTKIIDGDLPAHFVHRDDTAVAFMSIEPLRPGHVLVVPVTEVDHWLDLDQTTLAHLVVVSQRIGLAIADAFPSQKVAMMIAGLEVPHVHIHLVPIDGVHDLDFSNATAAEQGELAAAAQSIAVALAG